MIHKPIAIKDLELSLTHKTCFANFNYQIACGSRIAIIGRNGSGKSTLLKMLADIVSPSSGTINIRNDVITSYVPQIIDDHTHFSGGERLNAAITQALSIYPNLLLLDEPTNHLDSYNRKNLIRMLNDYSGTLIIASHDTGFIRNCTDILWHIDNEKIHIFSGNYDDYIHESKIKRNSIENDLTRLKTQRKETHNKLMKEQKRAASSKLKGMKSLHNGKWSRLAGSAKALTAQQTAGRKKSAIYIRKDHLTEELNNMRLPEIIVPKFSLNCYDTNDRTLIQISNGLVEYAENQQILSNINLSISSNTRIAIIGDNASGKSTFVKAILNNENIFKSGDWFLPKTTDIGYLDQHYSTLDSNKSVVDTISELMPDWSLLEVRSHLNDFLFRKNEEVNARASTLSGGEKARLSLAIIAALHPKLLILDEITNNLDIETNEHVIQVLNAYKGAMIVISHDNNFLEAIAIDQKLDIQQFKIV